MKKAFITGITGQDGSYLAELLLKKGYKVFGLIRKTTHFELENIKHIQNQINLIYGDLLDSVSLSAALKSVQPDELYNLAAQSSPGVSFNQPIHSTEVTGLGAHRIFEAVRDVCPRTKVYQASSSEMYGWVKKIPQNEDTPFNPANPYAAAKLYAHSMAKIYRKSYDLYISCGILFNHESPRRGMGFVTQKISYAAACAKKGIRTSKILNEEGEPIFNNSILRLGNLEAQRDWGYAGDYVLCMWKMLQQESPDDYVIGTGETHSVAEFCKEAFEYVGIKEWGDHIEVDPRFVRPTETGPLVADCTKAQKELNWKSKTSFKKLVKMLVDNHLNNLS